jgi:hypothetical protein
MATQNTYTVKRFLHEQPSFSDILSVNTIPGFTRVLLAKMDEDSTLKKGEGFIHFSIDSCSKGGSCSTTTEKVILTQTSNGTNGEVECMILDDAF